MRVRGCHGKGVYQTEMTVFTVSRGKPVFNLSDGVKTKRTVRSVTRIIPFQTCWFSLLLAPPAYSMM